MLARVAAFEVRYQLRAPLFAVGYALFFLLAFGLVATDELQIGGTGASNVNSPFAIALTTATLGVFAVFIAAAFVANVIVRDDETGFAPLIQSTRIGKRDYLVGRFAGASLVAFAVLAAVPMGMLAGSWMPWLDPEKLGPFRAGHYLYALFVVELPTLLTLCAGSFALATVTRSMMWTYVGLVAVLVLYSTSRLLLRDTAWDAVASLTDPFDLSSMGRATRYWTVADRNTMLPPLAGPLLYNRLIWLAVGLGLFLAAYWRFRFAPRSATPVRADAVPVDRASAMAPFSRRPLPQADPASNWRQFAALARFDSQFVFRSFAFYVLVALGMINAFGGMSNFVSQRGVEYLPVTRAMVEVLIESYAFIPPIIAIYYAGELVWRDRERRIHEIVGATPAQDWAFVLPKVLAIAGVLAAAYLASVLLAVVFQLAHGRPQVEIGQYLLAFVAPEVTRAFLLAVLTVFVQTLVSHKFLGWAVMLVYVVATLSLAAAGFEHNLYLYASAPPVPLSDMNGMGRFWVGRAWFHAYWGFFAVVLVVLTRCLWRRGSEERLLPRLRRLSTWPRGASGALLAAGLAAWAGCGAFIFWNTNVLNRYVTDAGREAMLAAYEKALLPYEAVPQPRITDVNLAVELYPRDARAVTRGEYAIVNRTGAPLSVVHVRWNTDPRLAISKLEVQGATLEREHADFHYRVYRFEAPMQPGEKRVIRFATVLEERGFPNSRPLTRIVENGSLLGNDEVAPMLGLDRGILLRDRAKRRKHGLAADLRPAKLEDDGARARNYLRSDSDWVNADILLTTDADQIPVAPGRTISDRTENGRRTLHARSAAPVLNLFSLQSGRYAVRTDTWTPGSGEPVSLSVYHHPAHEHIVPLMIEAMKASLETFGPAFSSFPGRQARILEFPAYATFAQSFADTVPYSEGIGFIQRRTAPAAEDEGKLDLVTYVTAHEIAHQWWAHLVVGADMQGATMLSETLAQYSALLVMERLCEEAGPRHDALITYLFERITLYDLKAKEAVARQRADGKFDTTLSIEAAKLYADGRGKEEPAPLAESFDIGAFSVVPGGKGYSKASVLSVERHPIGSGPGQVSFVADALPKWVGIDPFNKRIDRNSEDNFAQVTLAR